MKKKILLFLILFLTIFNISVQNVYASPSTLSDFDSHLANLSYTDNSWLPDTYLNGTYNNYAVFYFRMRAGSNVTSGSRYLYCFCYNDSFGIYPFYLVSNDYLSSTYNQGTQSDKFIYSVTQYSSSNLSDTYGKWYCCYIEDSPSSITWSECDNSVTGFDYNRANNYFDVNSPYSFYSVYFDYDTLAQTRYDGTSITYDDNVTYTLYARYLFGTSNIYTDDTLTDVVYSDNVYDFYGDVKSSSENDDDSDVDYSSGGVFSWIADFFKSLIDYVKNIPENVFNAFKTLLNAISSVVTNVFNAIIDLPGNIIDLLSDLLEFLFVPDEEYLVSLRDDLEEKFGFVWDIIELSNEVLLVGNHVTDDMPNFTIELYGVECTFIDFSMYNQYRNFIHSIIIAIAWFYHIIWLVVNIPIVLGGYGGVVRVNDYLSFRDTYMKK